MPQSASRVFLNIPFDEPYEPIFIGLIGALIHLGKYPTTVLELGGGTAPRLDRLIAAIRAMVEAFSIAGSTDMGAARRLVRRLGRVADNLKRAHRAETVFSRTICNELINSAGRLRGQ